MPISKGILRSEQIWDVKQVEQCLAHCRQAIAGHYYLLLWWLFTFLIGQIFCENDNVIMSFSNFATNNMHE